MSWRQRNQATEGGEFYGEWNSLVVSFGKMNVLWPRDKYKGATMQTEIEILEPRENPCILWT